VRLCVHSDSTSCMVPVKIPTRTHSADRQPPSADEMVREQLADPSASLAVVFGAGGVLESKRRGYAYIDHSTIDEATGHISTSASLGFTDYSRVDMLVLRSTLERGRAWPHQIGEPK